MIKTVATTSRGTLERRTGSTGPRHDLYWLDEWTWTAPDGSALVLRCDSFTESTTLTLIPVPGAAPQTLVEASRDGLAEAGFIGRVGYDPEQLERWGAMARSRCRCGSRRIEVVDGYPGETLWLCTACARIVDYTFTDAGIV
jgi:hypothetical protein